MGELAVSAMIPSRHLHEGDLRRLGDRGGVQEFAYSGLERLPAGYLFYVFVVSKEPR